MPSLFTHGTSTKTRENKITSKKIGADRKQEKQVFLFVCRHISRTSPASSLRASKIVPVVFHFIRVRFRVAGAAASAEKPRPPSPQLLPPALPGGSRGVPRPAERYNPSSVSWVDPGVSSRWDMPETPPEGGVLTRCPNHLNWLLSTWRSKCWYVGQVNIYTSHWLVLFNHISDSLYWTVCY